MTTAMKARAQVGDLIRFGDRDIEAEIVSIHHGWILARVDEPTKQGLPYGYVMVRESHT